MAVDDLEDRIDALYRGDPAAFVAARDALVKELRAEKRRDDANAVKALRRPTVAAWALDQLRDAHPGDLVELADAGAALRAAQRAMLAGDRSGVRAASDRRRAVVDRLARAAARHLGDGGTTDELVATLEAAALDGEVFDLLRRGRLVRTTAPRAGFGDGAGGADDDDGDLADLLAASVAPRGDDRDDEDGARDLERERARRAAAADEAEDDWHEARARAVIARDEAEVAQREHRDADAEVRRLERELAAAQRVADRRRTDADAATAAAEAAEEAATAARERSVEARRRLLEIDGG